jgi:hypothetical protein
MDVKTWYDLDRLDQNPYYQNSAYRQPIRDKTLSKSFKHPLKTAFSDKSFLLKIFSTVSVIRSSAYRMLQIREDLFGIRVKLYRRKDSTPAFISDSILLSHA